MSNPISPENMLKLQAAVANGDITEEEASKLVRTAILEAGEQAAAAAREPHPLSSEKWSHLMKFTPPTPRSIVVAKIKQENFEASDHVISDKLLEAAESGYSGFQNVIEEAQAEAHAQASEVARQEWLRTDPEGMKERERLLNEEAAAIVAQEEAAATRAKAARVILGQRGIDASEFEDAEVTSMVYGKADPPDDNSLAANIAAAEGGSK